VTLLCLIWLVGFTAAPIMQSWVIREASDAPNLASTLMNTASQVGIAGGAALGALLIASGWGYSQIPLFSAIFYAAGFVGALILAASDRRRKPALA
jgi:DHA1 family inner membrane transport protein